MNNFIEIIPKDKDFPFKPTEISQLLKEFNIDKNILGDPEKFIKFISLDQKFSQNNESKKIKHYEKTVNQFFGRKQSPFSSVALVQIFQNETMVTAFVTDRHGNGTVSVFVPTGPNPTSGFIYHIPEKYVHPVDVPVEDAMRSVISCGAGSEMLVKKLREESPTNSE